jgi:hypothetical protein
MVLINIIIYYEWKNTQINSCFYTGVRWLCNSLWYVEAFPYQRNNTMIIFIYYEWRRTTLYIYLVCACLLVLYIMLVEISLAKLHIYYYYYYIHTIISTYYHHGITDTFPTDKNIACSPKNFLSL